MGMGTLRGTAVAAAGLHSIIPTLAAIWTIAIAFVGIAWWLNQKLAIAPRVCERLLLLPRLDLRGPVDTGHKSSTRS
jgi:hypothetical protein